MGRNSFGGVAPSAVEQRGSIYAHFFPLPVAASGGKTRNMTHNPPACKPFAAPPLGAKERLDRQNLMLGWQLYRHP